MATSGIPTTLFVLSLGLHSSRPSVSPSSVVWRRRWRWRLPPRRSRVSLAGRSRLTTWLQAAKSEGATARTPPCGVADELCPFGGRPHAKMESSLVFFMISSCRRRKGISPTPYCMGIITSKIPKRQYARSSFFVVFLHAAHNIHCATLVLCILVASLSTRRGIPVIFSISTQRSYFVPRRYQSKL